jgi:ketosteroid isomerase-like protein
MTIARPAAFIALSVLALSANPTNAKDKPTMQDITGLKNAERVWVESLETADAKRLATIIDERFVFIGPDGEVEKRDAYLAGYAALPQLGVVVEGIDLSEVEIRVLGEIGIVTGRAVARVKMQGAPLTEDVRFTRVYRRSAGGWQMVTGQGTRITPPAPASAKR